MFKLRTNTEVTISSRSSEEAYVVMQVGPINVSKRNEEMFYRVKIDYYKEVVVDTGELDENDNPIMKTVYRLLPKVPDIIFSKTQADGIEDLKGPLSGSHNSDQFLDLVKKGINFQLDLPQEYGGHPYGLNSTGWTLLS
jgi:hypothetical protein